MENSKEKVLLSFLSEQESLTERRIQDLNNFLDNTDFSLPTNISDTLNSLRQNAEDDLSNIYHIQSTYTSAQARSASRQLKCQSPVRTGGGSVLAQLERVQECGEVLLVGDEEDLFPLEVEDGHLASVRSPESGWSQWSESEPDEGIDIPAKFREKTQAEQVAASLPVGIPWPSHLPGGLLVKETDSALTGAEEVGRPSDIAASIQAMARSVHTSSIFGDNVFGELPRPRVNTFSKD